MVVRRSDSCLSRSECLVRLHTIRRSKSGVQLPALESLTMSSNVTQRSVTVAREKNSLTPFVGFFSPRS